MSGTKMTLHRYGGRKMEFDDQLIVIDQNWLDTHEGYYISLIKPYEVGSQTVDVYLNGQLLSLGGGYEEVDNQTIRIDLGSDLEGNTIKLTVTDEIYIRVWKNHYHNTGLSPISNTSFMDLQSEVKGILNYSMGGNINLEYEYDDKERIIKETVTGDYDLTRHVAYNEISEVSEEKVYYKGKIITRSYSYDYSTRKLLSASVTVTT